MYLLHKFNTTIISRRQNDKLFNIISKSYDQHVRLIVWFADKQ